MNRYAVSVTLYIDAEDDAQALATVQGSVDYLLDVANDDGAISDVYYGCVTLLEMAEVAP